MVTLQVDAPAVQPDDRAHQAQAEAVAAQAATTIETHEALEDVVAFGRGDTRA